MNHQPLVSIIMNCHNGEKYIAEAIDSVLEQTYSNWELIIWDNCSIDSTALISKSYNDKRIKYFLSEKLTKLGEARNLAIQNTSGDFIGFLDCDDLYLQNKIELQVKEFNNEKVGIVISDSLFFNHKGDSKQLYKNNKPPTGMVFTELLSSYFISLETVIIRTKALKGLDHWFNTQFEVIEEYDLLVRLGYSWEIAYVDQVLAKWRVHNSSWTWTKSELFPIEKKIMLSNLSKNIEKFDKIYSNEITLSAPKGSVVVYNGSLWHGSGQNQSDDTRWAIIYSYARWFIKPSFDFNRNTPKAIYDHLTERQKELLGYKFNPPQDEFSRITSKSASFEEPLPYILP